MDEKETLLNAKEEICGQRELDQEKKEKILSNSKVKLDATRSTRPIDAKL